MSPLFCCHSLSKTGHVRERQPPGQKEAKEKKKVDDSNYSSERLTWAQLFLISFTLDKDRLSNVHGFDSCFRRQSDHLQIVILLE